MDIPYSTYDGWKVTPPCERAPFDCDHRCPYYHSDCWGDDEPEDDEPEDDEPEDV